MAAVDKTLEERGTVYGDYAGGLKFRRAILDLIYARYDEVHNDNMTDEHKDYFVDLVGKISRLAVSPTHEDSWHDAAGYSLLIEEVIKDDSSR